MPIDPQPGDVWYADLGLAEKSRPVLILAYPQSADARSLVIVAPLTSQIRGQRGEVQLGKPRWLPKPSAVNVQGLASFDRHKLTRRLGMLSVDQFAAVKDALRELLQL
ncbi:MAG: type II toxin-antitoxin system PemK/MazF family toxin [Planctomycetia bacterium]|nr:type II toxin-antitoxin system PemK/MazF family toxin [Planctomycetia bacterium]